MSVPGCAMTTGHQFDSRNRCLYCGWQASPVIQPRPAWIWAKDARLPDVPAHELGHPDSEGLKTAYIALRNIAKYPNAITRKMAEDAMAEVDRIGRMR